MEQEIKKKNRVETIQYDDDHDNEKWVFDSSLDHAGKVPLRSSTGVWKASIFIIAIEFSERLSYFGIATNLITYLTNKMGQDLPTAAKNVNCWTGVTTLMPLVGGFLADAYTGRFSMILLSSILYFMGLALLTTSELIPSLNPCTSAAVKCSNPHHRKIHEVVFFLALYLISLGTGGHKPCLESFGGDQFDDDHPQERKQKMSYFNLWNFALCCGLLLGVTLIVYVQDYVSWGVADLVLTLAMAMTVMIFYSGKGFYRYRVPSGSPLTPMLQVLVAAFRKRNLPRPSSPDFLYEVPKSLNAQGRLLCHTDHLRFLDKAAIMEGNEDLLSQQQPNPWRLAPVTRVEEMKLLINTIPIWLTSLIFGMCMAQAATFFVKQSHTMNRKIGNSFVIPPASITTISAITMLISITVYEKILVPILRRATGNERGIRILQRIGIGMAFSVLSMTIAALVERKRLGVAERETTRGEGNGSLSMSVFWLAPQFIVVGIADVFTLVGLQEYFYDQVPDSMRSLGMAFYLSVIGLGSFLSSFLITIVHHVTDRGGTSWIDKDLKSSRLDKFYWLLAVLSGLNLCVFVLLAKRYRYKNVQRSAVLTDSSSGNGGESMA